MPPLLLLITVGLSIVVSASVAAFIWVDDTRRIRGTPAPAPVDPERP